jgi:hypothetical protein
MPASNVPELRARLDAFARSRLTSADFEPVLDLDGELPLEDVTPEFFQVLHLLEPYGAGNPEPVFAARAVQLSAPPRILKDTHVKLKVRGGELNLGRLGAGSEEPSAAAIVATPSCHPDSSAIGRNEKNAAVADSSTSNRTENGEPGTKLRITFDVLGWRMAERLRQKPLLAGDTIEIAFTIGHNDHPQYGGLELCLRDFKA